MEFLQKEEEQAYINIDETNPRLYDHVPEMMECKVKLKISNYLFFNDQEGGISR